MSAPLAGGLLEEISAPPETRAPARDVATSASSSAPHQQLVLPWYNTALLCSLREMDAGDRQRCEEIRTSQIDSRLVTPVHRDARTLSAISHSRRTALSRKLEVLAARLVRLYLFSTQQLPAEQQRRLQHRALPSAACDSLQCVAPVSLRLSSQRGGCLQRAAGGALAANRLTQHQRESLIHCLTLAATKESRPIAFSRCTGRFVPFRHRDGQQHPSKKMLSSKALVKRWCHAHS